MPAMEIHAPEGPIESWKDTAKHLAIITAGVLIALALEGVVAWADHRLLVREATSNLTAELRNNRKELNGLLTALDIESKQLERASDLADLLLAKKPPARIELALEWHDAELKNAAVTTGQITGAFGYMEYKEVSRYADVYDLQAQFMRQQEREVQHLTDVLAFVRRLDPPPSGAVNADALERWKSQIDTAIAGVGWLEIVGRQLLKRYDELLTR